MPTPFRLVLTVMIAALPSVATAAENSVPAETVRDYDTCMRLVLDRAEAALEAALAWEQKGGGGSARHCAAMALAAIGNFSAAADQLESLAWELPAETPDATRAEILAQAGQFWLDAHQPAKADALLSAAVDLAPEDPQIRIDRAMAFAATGRFQDAVIDLSVSIILDPEPVEALVLRASAYRQSGRPAEAEEDLKRALALAPDDAGALLERGLLRRQAGELKGALADWRSVIKHHPDSPAAGAARQHLKSAGGARRGER